MNLQKRADEYAINNTFINRKTQTVFISGFRCAIADVKSFLKANPKCTPDIIIKYLESIK